MANSECLSEISHSAFGWTQIKWGALLNYGQPHASPPLLYVFTVSFSPWEDKLTFQVGPSITLWGEDPSYFKEMTELYFPTRGRKREYLLFLLVCYFFPPKAKNKVVLKGVCQSPNTIFPSHSLGLYLAPCKPFPIGHPSHISTTENNPQGYRTTLSVLFQLSFSLPHFIFSYPLIYPLIATKIAIYPLSSDWISDIYKCTHVLMYFSIWESGQTF